MVWCCLLSYSLLRLGFDSAWAHVKDILAAFFKSWLSHKAIHKTQKSDFLVVLCNPSIFLSLKREMRVKQPSVGQHVGDHRQASPVGCSSGGK